MCSMAVESLRISVMRLVTGTRSEKSSRPMRSVLAAIRPSERDSRNEARPTATIASRMARPAASTARSSNVREAACNSTTGTAAAMVIGLPNSGRNGFDDQPVVAAARYNIAFDPPALVVGFDRDALERAANLGVAAQARWRRRHAGFRFDGDV